MAVSFKSDLLAGEASDSGARGETELIESKAEVSRPMVRSCSGSETGETVQVDAAEGIGVEVREISGVMVVSGTEAKASSLDSNACQ